MRRRGLPSRYQTQAALYLSHVKGWHHHSSGTHNIARASTIDFSEVPVELPQLLVFIKNATLHIPQLQSSTPLLGTKPIDNLIKPCLIMCRGSFGCILQQILNSFTPRPSTDPLHQPTLHA